MNVLVGVSGGIACYKAAELIRELQGRGADVQVVMTKAAQQFVSPLTFASLTGKPVLTSLWSGQQQSYEDGSIEHIAVAQRIDAFVIAPATANVIAQLAHGLASDYLTTVYLATKAPVIIAPAMNVNMWEHPATQANIETLRKHGVSIIPPEEGYLACGMQGGGRLADEKDIADTVIRIAQPKQDLRGKTVLITAGGTREPIDPVRYIGNRSSGKMGHALAEVAKDRGANVVLITTSSLPVPAQIDTVRVSTAKELEDAVLDHLHATDIVIMAAAVADFRPKELSTQKIRRTRHLTLELEPTEDIVAKIAAQRRPETRVIAFAAETESLVQNARAKLVRKGADAIVANDVSSSQSGFDVDTNAGIFLTTEKAIPLPISKKRDFAHKVLDMVLLLESK